MGIIGGGGKSWQQFDEIFTPYLNRMKKISSHPLSICEFGTTAKIINKQYKVEYNPELKKEWIRYAYEWLRKDENINKYNIKMAIYYNLSKNDDIDSGIFILNKPSNIINSLDYKSGEYKTIKNLKEVYINKNIRRSQNNRVKRSIFKKVGFVNNNIKMNQNIFEGDF